MSSLIVYSRNLQDYSPKPTFLCTFICKPKIKKNSPFKKHVIVFFQPTENIEEGHTGGGLWHDSRMKKIMNHGSRILKFHFPESRK